MAIICTGVSQACYEIQPAVHRLWRPILGELDDYIFNPKASGYQSLHSAVLGEPIVQTSLSLASTIFVLLNRKEATWLERKLASLGA